MAIPFAAISPPAMGQGLLQVRGKAADRVRVLSVDASDAAVELSIGDSWMARRTGGVLAEFSGTDLKRLQACIIGGARRGGLDPSAAEWGRLIVERGGESKVGIVRRREDNRLTVVFGDEESWFLIDPAKFSTLTRTPSALFTGSLRPNGGEANAGRVLERTFHRAADLTVDRESMRKRFFAGFDLPPAAKLKRGSEGFQVRVPRVYDPKFPAGLVVWISPSPHGSPPETFFEIADEMNMFIAGADASGNDRSSADRLQLALDVTVCMIEAYHIDERRVYVSGLSGGGKIATILQACCPEIFAGCVPIVGTGWWRDEPVPGGGGKSWPRLFARPTEESRAMLALRRIAPMTGSDDFNQGPVLAFSRQMEEDGVPVRVFDVEGMGHTMPPVDSLRGALMWVDEEWRDARAKEETRGKELMREYLSENEAGPLQTERARVLLRRMTAEAPWTVESWQAVEWLGKR